MTERMGSQTTEESRDSEAFIVLAQADTTDELDPNAPATNDAATGAPRALVDAEETDDAPVANTAQSEAAPIELDIEPLAPGERRVVDVSAGSTVALREPDFDPSNAVYAVDGNDLVVTTADGGVLILSGFFAAADVEPSLVVLDGPATPAGDLLARAEAAPAAGEDVQPATGPETTADIPGGAGAFRAYDQGSIGPGLDPLGPLGPTALASTISAPEQDPIEFFDDGGDGDGNGDNGNGPSPGSSPELTLRESVATTIGEGSADAFNPATTPIIPLGDRVLNPVDDGIDRSQLNYRQWLATRGFPPIADEDVNNVDQDNLTLDRDREVFVELVNEDSFSIDTLFVHEIAEDGSIINPRIVFDGVNKPGDPLSNLKETPLGTEVSLGTYEGGTQLGFILLNDGFRENDLAALEGGRFEVRDPVTGEISKITDFQGDTNPRIVHIADDGTETVLIGQRVFTADASQFTPNNNRLNSDGLGHFVSGWDDTEGRLVIGAEEASPVPSDRDFTDVVFGVRFGSPLEPGLVFKDRSLDAEITDADSTELTGATVVLTGLLGDSVVLDPAAASGTPIEITQVSPTELLLSGTAPLEDYVQVINEIKIEIDLEAAQTGGRNVEVTVFDTEGNSGSASTEFAVDDNLLAGTDEADTPADFPATSVTTPDSDGRDVVSGRGGSDDLSPLSGDDVVDGGEGRDTIDVRFIGSNIITGGPQPDQITLGPGADTVRITGLGDGRDTVFSFDATEGDKLDLTQLFRDSSINDGNVADFLGTAVDASGNVTVRADIDGADDAQRFVDVALLVTPTGVTATTDPTSFVITPTTETAVA